MSLKATSLRPHTLVSYGLVDTGPVANEAHEDIGAAEGRAEEDAERAPYAS